MKISTIRMEGKKSRFELTLACGLIISTDVLRQREEEANEQAAQIQNEQPVLTQNEEEPTSTQPKCANCKRCQSDFLLQKYSDDNDSAYCINFCAAQCLCLV